MSRWLLLVAVLGIAGCDPGPPISPRPSTQTCRPLVGSAPASTLSATHCFRDVARLIPAEDLIPYGVNSPLFSDGATKRRWLVLPPDATLTIVDDEIAFPIGAVLIKLFSLTNVNDAERSIVDLEVRFFVKEEFEWAAFTYRFGDDGDARLLERGEDELFVVGEQEINYHFPARATCRSCHRSDLPVLGFTFAQLDGTFDYGHVSADQLTALSDAGLFEEPLSPERGAALSDPADVGEPLDRRARSWLHANCGHCHRPGGWASTVYMDLRFETPLSETNTCRERMRFFGSGFNRIEPGWPEASGMIERMNAESPFRMPPVGVSFTDPFGEPLIRAWILSMTDCD